MDGLGCRVDGLGCRVDGLGNRVDGLGYRVEGSESKSTRVSILAVARIAGETCSKK